tara:strand:- start:1333 stop:1440 length:108 start_codon:yes stop_codon:yes gene_type:complete
MAGSSKKASTLKAAVFSDFTRFVPGELADTGDYPS